MEDRRTYSDAEIDAAIEALNQPGAMDQAQRLVTSRAPQLQQILNQALMASDWFGPAHREAVEKSVASGDPHERAEAVHRLVAEETRLTMLVGVAAGLELAHLLDHPQEDQD